MSTGRGLRVALGVSLAVNLAVIGLIGGAIWRKGGWDGHPPHIRAFGAPYVRALPEEQRRRINKAVRQVRPDRRARRDHYRNIVTALRAPDWDPAPVQAALDGQARSAGEVVQVASQAWLAEVSDMTHSERQAYADRLEEVLQRGPRKKRKPGGG